MFTARQLPLVAAHEVPTFVDMMQRHRALAAAEAALSSLLLHAAGDARALSTWSEAARVAAGEVGVLARAVEQARAQMQEHVRERQTRARQLVDSWRFERKKKNTQSVLRGYVWCCTHCARIERRWCDCFFF